MNKFVKRDYFYILCLGLVYLAIVLFITHGTNLYGSTLDWDTQHYAFADYFRSLFYETGNLIPNFAPNIGAGQNIFYFAYYGFLSPIVLFSYLFPMVSMVTYIQVSSFLVVFISVCLFYKWLLNNGFSSKLCFVGSFIFLMASPLIFHSHRHIMFISYMPFLILGLMSVDLFFKRGKMFPLALCVFLIIMTSYFYSVSAIFALSLYAVFVYLKDGFVFRDFVKAAFKYLFTIFVGILSAMVILLPVLYVLLHSRGASLGSSSFASLVVPHFGLEYALYGHYSLGLTAIFVVALFTNILYRDKLFLNAVLLLLICFNIFVYLLNGTLYLDGKALIPFLPLCVFVIVSFLDNVFKGKFKYFYVILGFALSLIFVILFSLSTYAVVYILDALLFLYLLYRYFKFGDVNKFLVPFMVLLFVFCLCVNFGDRLVLKRDYYRENDSSILKLTNYITSHDKSYYRMIVFGDDSHNTNKIVDVNQRGISLYSSTFNKDYNDFFYNVYNNNLRYRNSSITDERGNVLFESFMGVKYLITSRDVSFPYKLLKRCGDYGLYVNEDAMPVFYAMHDTMSYASFDSLSFPFNIFALNNYVISKDGNSKVFLDSSIKSIPILKDDVILKNLEVISSNGLKSGDCGHMILKFKEKAKSAILVRIKVSKPSSCTSGDTSITIDGVKNKLTCKEWKYFNNNYTFDYTLTKDTDKLDLKFSKGTYYIDSISVYSYPISSLKRSVTPFNVKEAKGDHIEGDIKVSSSGYFVLKIPYDEGFRIKVDGKEVNYEKVDKAFMGFKIRPGYHKIVIDYASPWYKEGLVLSMVGFGFMFLLLILSLKGGNLGKRVLNFLKRFKKIG